MSGHVMTAGDATALLDALAGHGVDARVRCESPEWAVRWRTGYAPRPNDLHDVPLLCARFGIPLPAGF